MAASACSIAAAFAIQACGETDHASTPVDAGTNADSGHKDAASPDTGASPCDTSVSFTDKIPDAAIADGASTSGICVQCVEKKCATQVEACNKDCTCQGLAGDALSCFLKTPQNPIVCAGQFINVDSNTRDIGLGLLTCAATGCKTECATESFQPPPDGGKPDGGSPDGDGGDGG
jgi:hypothetical protein